jgi:hypothetical protein
VIFGMAGCFVALFLAIRALHRSNDFSLWAFAALFLGIAWLLASAAGFIGITEK